jgi:uncharacterized protein
MAGDVFHAGEVALQREAGVAERLERLGSQVIRDYLPEQHRAFFPLLPWLIAGSMDEQGQPTASLLTGTPGFVSSPDARTLRVAALPLAGDALEQNLSVGAPLALLGLQPHTRRRNRANGSVLDRDARGFVLAVRQSFGNCPKYIQRRLVSFSGPRGAESVSRAEQLSAHDRAQIARADTFFIASAHPGARSAGARAHGLDVSHRGGPPGFVAFEDADTLVIPDFRGNDFYNTLGNLSLHALAGLLFVDVQSGDLLQVRVAAEVAYGTHPLAGDAQVRLVRFRVHGASRFSGASRLEFAPLPSNEEP